MIRIDAVPEGGRAPQCRWCGGVASHHVYPDAPRAHPRWNACTQCLAIWRARIDAALRKQVA